MSSERYHSFFTSEKTLRKALVFFDRRMKAIHCDEDTYLDLKIAFSELINNAIHHGNRGDTNKKIYVSIALFDKRVMIRVRDEGGKRSFNPDDLPDPTASSNILLPTGRGLFLVKRLMDNTTFRNTESGMEIVVEKKIA
jgi:serine/threonine-protein kinase RsbW